MIFRYVSLAGVGRRQGNRGAEKLNRGVSVFRHLLGEPKRDDKNRNPVRGKDLTRGGFSVASAAASVFGFFFFLFAQRACVFSATPFKDMELPRKQRERFSATRACGVGIASLILSGKKRKWMRGYPSQHPSINRPSP